jgi:iron-sulfur cluster assembly 2
MFSKSISYTPRSILFSQFRRITTGTFSQLQITCSAVKKLSTLSPKILRIQIDTGGCHGFQYNFNLIENIQDKDILFLQDGQKVVCDEITLDLLQGSKLDYVEELIGSAFQIVDNPRAESSCGCKVSFNIK